MKTISTWNKLIPFFAGLFLSILLVTSVTGTVTAAQNLDSWSSTKGTLNPADVTPSRFRFIDPTTIEDTVTGDTYTTSASQDELYSDSTRGHMRDPGWFWYWPGDDDGPVMNSSDSNPQCTGGLVLRATDANNDEIGSLSLYAVGAIKIGSSCAVPNGSANDYDGIQSDTKGKGDDPHNDNEYELTQVDNSTFRMAVSMFVWNNEQNIGVYDSSRGLRRLTDTEVQLVKNRTGETYPDSTIWTHDDCEQNNGLPNAFLLVANSDKDVGRVFYDANNTYHGSWSGDQLTCLMGRELKDNQTDLANTVSDNSNVVYIAHQENAGADGEPPVDGVDNTGGGGTGTASNGDSCEDSGWELSWIACPLLFGADKALNWITEQINHLLQVPDSYIRPDSDPEALQNIWSRFRDIAYMILIPIMLVMVISTALGFDFFSAYTVKKAMPRMVLAIMFITFSFYITEFLVLLTNDIGKGTHGLIIGVVKPGGEDITLASLFEPQGVQDSVFWGTAGVLALAGTAAVAGVTVLLSYAFTTIIVLIIGLFLLALRQMLIIGLMVFAPLAILSWIFPGNDKLWKLWWGSFSKLLLMFPLIMALIATGKIFGFIVEQSSSASDAGNGQLLFTGLKLLAFVAPFFFIPATFKFAGGVFGTLTGMANDRARGIFDRNRKFRGQKMAQNWQNTKDGRRFGENNAVSRRFNRVGGGLGMGRKGGFGFGERGKTQQSLRRQVAEEQAMKENPALQKFVQTDDDGAAMLGLSGGTNQGLREASAQLQNHWLRRDMESFRERTGRDMNETELLNARGAVANRVARAESAAKSMGVNRANAGAAMVGVAQNKARALEGEGAIELVQEGARRMGGGNDQLESATLQGFMYHARGNGRQDLGHTDFEGAWDKQSIGAIVSGDTRSTQNFADHIEREWTEGKEAGDTVKMEKAAVKMAELQGALPGATEGNAKIINQLAKKTFGYNEMADKGLEDQLAEQINTTTDLLPGQAGPARSELSGETIYKQARKYSKDTTEAERLRYQQEEMARRIAGQNQP